MGRDGTSPGVEPGEDQCPSLSVRPIAGSEWSGLLWTDPVVSQPATGGLLRPFAGVLGPWHPSAGTLPPRLSFLALPWLIREVHTTERIAVERAETAASPPTDRTPETTTVYRLLRTDDDPETPPGSRADPPSDDAVLSNAATLHEVLAWRPVLIDGSTLPGRAGDTPDRTDRIRATEPAPVARTLRSFDLRERPGDGGTDRTGNTGAATGATGDRRAGRGPWAGSGAGTPDRRDAGGSTASVGSARPWVPGARTPGGIRLRTGIGRPTEGLRPRLPTGAHTTVLPHLGRDPRAGTVEPSRFGGSDAASGSPVRTPPDSPVGWSTSPGRTGSDGTVSGSAESPAPASDDGSGPVTLTYREAGARDGGTRQATGTPERRSAGSLLSPTVATVDPAAQGVSLGEGGPTVGAPGGTATRQATARPDTPAAAASPFASFPDTESAIDHVYREIERRWRIDRERRGL